MLAALLADNVPASAPARLRWHPAVTIGPSRTVPFGTGFWLVRDPRVRSVMELDYCAELPDLDVEGVAPHLALGLPWHARAACREAPNADELFFSVDDTRAGLAKDTIREARSYCARCPVARECLQWALTVPERAGIWGGTTWYRRQRLLTRIKGGANLEVVIDACLASLPRP